MNYKANSQSQVKQLSMCHGGVWPVSSFGVGGRPAEPVPYEIRPFWGRQTLFDLKGIISLGCGGAGENVHPPDTAQEMLEYLEQKGVSLSDLDTLIARLDSVLIGVEMPRWPWWQWLKRCTDLALSVAVLSRTVGGIFFRDREPDYDPAHLLPQIDVFDADFSELLPECAIEEERYWIRR
jgi:hypothetical protein